MAGLLGYALAGGVAEGAKGVSEVAGKNIDLQIDELKKEAQLVRDKSLASYGSDLAGKRAKELENLKSGNTLQSVREGEDVVYGTMQNGKFVEKSRGALTAKEKGLKEPKKPSVEQQKYDAEQAKQRLILSAKEMGIPIGVDPTTGNISGNVTDDQLRQIDAMAKQSGLSVFTTKGEVKDIDGWRGGWFTDKDDKQTYDITGIVPSGNTQAPVSESGFDLMKYVERGRQAAGGGKKQPAAPTKAKEVNPEPSPKKGGLLSRIGAVPIGNPEDAPFARLSRKVEGLIPDQFKKTEIDPLVLDMMERGMSEEEIKKALEAQRR